VPEINSADKYNLEGANKVEVYVIYDSTSSEWVPAVSVEVNHDEDLHYQEFKDLRDAVANTVELFDKMLDQYEAE
jgi:hypothetical protein